jgi:hypothetical protein
VAGRAATGAVRGCAAGSAPIGAVIASNSLRVLLATTPGRFTSWKSLILCTRAEATLARVVYPAR